MRYHDGAAKGSTRDMQELRERLTALRERVSHVMVRL